MQLRSCRRLREATFFMVKDLPWGTYDVRARGLRSDNTEAMDHARVIVGGRDELDESASNSASHPPPPSRLRTGEQPHARRHDDRGHHARAPGCRQGIP